MSDSESVRSAVDAAERAAAAGDFQQAGRHLREAVAHQEAELGPAHPDLASTLNNLGIVCENLSEYDEAERCYRRAGAIVAAAFPSDHPFVATSRQNLEAFCEARGIPIDVPAPPSAQVVSPSDDRAPAAVPTPTSESTSIAEAGPTTENTGGATASVVTPSNAPSRPARHEPAASSPEPRPYRGLMAIAVVLIVAAFWMASRQHSSAPAPNPENGGAASTSSSPALAESTSAALVPSPGPPAASPRATTAPAPAQSRSTAPTETHGNFTVVTAELCGALKTGTTWTCGPLTDPAGVGPVFFYTRVASPRDAVIVHRWYRNDELVLDRQLRIEANASAGYRTYSRLTMDAESPGQWRVELRTPDGQVLREARFVVK